MRNRSSWIVVASRHNLDSLALDNLQRQHFQTYYPVIYRKIGHARRVQEVRRPIFPVYIFAQWEEGRSLPLRALAGTYGVRSVIMTGDRPAFLPCGFIEALREREVDGVIRKPAVPFDVGETVTVRGGAFDGLVGKIIDLHEKDRVVILLDLFRRETAVVVEASMLV